MKDILNKIHKVLKNNLWEKDYEFFLYGSRAKWDFFFRSDYDIWVLWKKKIKDSIKYQIKQDFEDIPALIDFTDFSDVSEDFKKNAMKDLIIIK